MKITMISDGTDTILEYQTPDDPKLAEFDKHKETLLDMLRHVYGRGLKSKPFDEDKAWRSLTGLAFRLGSVKQKTMPAADRVEGLRDIAKALGLARRLVNRAMKNDVGDTLYSAWCEENACFRRGPDDLEPPMPVRIKMFDPVRTKDEFDKALAGLATLETAASRAADGVPTKPGRPKGGAILSSDDIWNLGALYRGSTGLIPRSGDGPFAKFVMEVLTALGRADDINYQSVRGAIKDARRWALTHPVARKWGPSPFDEEK